MDETDTSLVPSESIVSRIYYIRRKKVMFDSDLAALYGVQPKVLNQAVKRNKKRFPDDFMFKLNKREMDIWKSQIVISKAESELLRSQFVTLENGRGKYSKYLPTVFTEQGVAMLSSVLKSERAIQVNIQIIRTFTKLRELLSTHKELREKIEKLEKRHDKQLSSHEKQFKVVFEAIKLLMKDKDKPAGEIGFKG